MVKFSINIIKRREKFMVESVEMQRLLPSDLIKHKAKNLRFSVSKNQSKIYIRNNKS
jgi:hypothetical protein